MLVIPNWLFYVIASISLLILLHFAWKYIFLWRRYNRLRSKAMKVQDWEKIIEIGDKQLKFNQPHAPLFHDMAIAYKKTGELDKAFEMALKLQQELYFKTTGRKPLHQEDFGDISAFQRASSQYLRSLKIIAETYLERGYAEKAREAFEYLSGVGGRYAECNLQLAITCLRMRDDIAAAKALKKLLHASPVKSVKLIRAHLDEILSLSPESIPLREFQAEFIRTEGNVKSEIEQLTGKALDGEIENGSLVLLSELVESENMQLEFMKTLDKLALNIINSNMDFPISFEQLAKRYHAEYAILALLNQKALTLPEETDPAIIQQIEEDVINIAMRKIDEPEVLKLSADTLIKIGSVRKALKAMEQTDLSQKNKEIRHVYQTAMKICREQVLRENPNMLSGKRDGKMYHNFDIPGYEKTHVSNTYQRFLLGEDLSNDELTLISYNLSTALSDENGKTTENKSKVMRILQGISESESLLKDAANLRIARIMAEENDLNSAKQYFTQIRSLKNIAKIAKEEVLFDGYKLGLAFEEEDPLTAFNIFKGLAFVDVNYKDVRNKRDLMLDKLPKELIDRTTSSAVQSGISTAQSPIPSSDIIMQDALSPMPGRSGVTGFIRRAQGKNLKEELTVNTESVLSGRYKIIEKLGEGGMGTVYKAEDLRIKRTVAIKVLHNNLDDNLINANERFELEAQLAGRLFQHKGVITVLDIADGPPSYIVMEYIEGISLRDLMLERELQEDEASTILYQVADTLAFAHQQGVIHRDIKPANILIEYMPLKTKVADFGLAKLANATDHLTSKGQVVGTKLYMSPEQVSGKHLNHKSDIYSWGIMAYEMCMGATPFTEGEISYQHVHVSPRKITPENAIVKLPKEFYRLIMQSLEKKPEDRPFDFQMIKAQMREIFPNLKD